MEYVRGVEAPRQVLLPVTLALWWDCLLQGVKWGIKCMDSGEQEPPRCNGQNSCGPGLV